MTKKRETPDCGGQANAKTDIFQVNTVRILSSTTGKINNLNHKIDRRSKWWRDLEYCTYIIEIYERYGVIWSNPKDDKIIADYERQMGYPHWKDEMSNG